MRARVMHQNRQHGAEMIHRGEGGQLTKQQSEGPRVTDRGCHWAPHTGKSPGAAG